MHAGAQVRALTGALQPAYWQALIVVSLLYFARFDASFITLRAKLVPPAAPARAACRGFLCYGLYASFITLRAKLVPPTAPAKASIPAANRVCCSTLPAITQMSFFMSWRCIVVLQYVIYPLAKRQGLLCFTPVLLELIAGSSSLRTISKTLFAGQ